MKQDLYPMFFGSDNAKAIYKNLVKLYSLPVGEFDPRYEIKNIRYEGLKIAWDYRGKSPYQ